MTRSYVHDIGVRERDAKRDERMRERGKRHVEVMGGASGGCVERQS